ncbi:MAG: AraC family transcriptional regulator [Bacteroides sp.]|nr:AraC family transcriptional regulator [Bacteroides sp.]MCM1549542.1 AraC family transcriptional regulator [Clostridium sp.]
MPSDFMKSLTQTIFHQREQDQQHISYEAEFAFYHAVKEGDLELVKEFMSPLDTEHMGKLSQHPVRNLRYHFIIAVAMIARFCIENGLPPEYAYTLSDLYIQKADVTDSAEGIQQLHREMIYDYTRQMQQLVKEQTYSRQIVLSLDYIYAHLQEPLTVKTIADAIHLNPCYLSTLFKKEMQVSISEYIRRERIKAAENLLKYSDFSATDISNYLCFSSHSHFIKIFKQYTGYTPRAYRNQFFRRSWE